MCLTMWSPLDVVRNVSTVHCQSSPSSEVYWVHITLMLSCSAVIGWHFKAVIGAIFWIRFPLWTHLPCDSPAVVFLDCQHSGFWDLYSTVPVNVVRVKSYVNCPLHQSQAWNSIQSQLSRTAYQWHIRNQIHHLKKICSMNSKCCDPRPKWLHPVTNNSIALLINSHLLSLNTQKSPSFLFLDQSVILLFWTEQLIMLIWNCFLFPFPYLVLLLMLVLPQVYQSTPWHKLPSLVLSLKVLHLKVQKALKKKCIYY